MPLRGAHRPAERRYGQTGIRRGPASAGGASMSEEQRQREIQQLADELAEAMRVPDSELLDIIRLGVTASPETVNRMAHELVWARMELALLWVARGKQPDGHQILEGMTDP